MPGMNGIEMVHRLNGMFDNMNIIIISGYDKFEFARLSIEEGARTYLLKPVKIEELEKWLITCRDEIRLRDHIEKEDNEIKNSLKLTIDMARGKFLESLLQSYSLEKEYILNMSQSLKLPTGRFRCTLATIVVCDFYDVMSKNYEDGIVLPERIKNALDITLATESTVLFTPLKPNRMAAVVCNMETSMDAFIQNVEVMCKTLRDEIGINISVILDHASINWDELHKLYRKSVEFLNYLGTLSSGQVFRVLKNEEYEKHFKPIYDAGELAKAITTEDIDSITMLSDAMFLNASDMPFENLHALVMSIAGELMQAIVKLNKMNGHVSLELWRDLLQADNYTSLNKVFSNILNTYVDGVAEKKKGLKHFIIERAVKYIHDNYQNDIAVQDMASYLNMNQSYLSVLFKKEMGQTISNYLSMIRIEKAKEYLINHNVKIHDITTLVGYQTPSYFTYQFKRHVGCTPAEFRERQLK